MASLLCCHPMASRRNLNIQFRKLSCVGVSDVSSFLPQFCLIFGEILYIKGKSLLSEKNQVKNICVFPLLYSTLFLRMFSCQSMHVSTHPQPHCCQAWPLPPSQSCPLSLPCPASTFWHSPVQHLLPNVFFSTNFLSGHTFFLLAVPDFALT